MAKKATKATKKTEQPAHIEEPAKPQLPESEGSRPTQSQERAKGEKLPGFFALFPTSLRMLGRHWKVFAGITALYGVLNVALVQGFNASGGLSEIKDSFDSLFTGQWGRLLSSMQLFVYLLGSSGNASRPTAIVYQIMLILIFSLALIWTLRQVYAGNKVGVRDGLYQGITPLVPFILVLAVISLQLLPLAIGATVYSAVVTNGIAVTAVEQLLWAVLFFATAGISLYLLSSSLFALYIVTLPGMTPLRALRSARELVRYRRFGVLRRIILLPIALLVLCALLVIPIILFATPLAAWVFLLLTMLLLPVVHSYMYALYRSLL